MLQLSQKSSSQNSKSSKHKVTQEKRKFTLQFKRRVLRRYQINVAEKNLKGFSILFFFQFKNNLHSLVENIPLKVVIVLNSN